MLAELFDEQAQRDDYNAARDRIIRAEGKTEGKAEKAIQVALSMITKGKLSLDDIAEYSGLSLEKVKELASQN